MKNEINNITINNSTNIKNVINPKPSFKENMYFILPDINLSDVLSSEEIEKVLKDKEMYETLIKNNKFESSNLREYLTKIDTDFSRMSNNEEYRKEKANPESSEDLKVDFNQNFEYIQFQEKVRDGNTFNAGNNSFSFKDETFFHNLLTEVKSLPFNRLTLINLLLDYAINLLIKAKKTPIAKGLEWVLKEIRENFSYQIDKSTVEYFEKMKDANQQINSVYEWVKEYSSYNDNQKNIYEFAKTKNLDSLRNKKPFNSNYSSNASNKYKKFKRLVTFNNPRAAGGSFSKAFGNTIGLAPYGPSSTLPIIEDFENLSKIGGNYNDPRNSFKRNSYSINKKAMDVIVLSSSVKNDNNTRIKSIKTSNEKSVDFIVNKKLIKNCNTLNANINISGYPKSNNNFVDETLEYIEEKNSVPFNSALSEKTKKHVESNTIHINISSSELKEDSMSKEHALPNSRSKTKNFTSKKTQKTNKKIVATATNAESLMLSKSPEKKNSSQEKDNLRITPNTDKSKSRFLSIAGKSTNSVINSYINSKISKKNLQNQNSKIKNSANISSNLSNANVNPSNLNNNNNNNSIRINNFSVSQCKKSRNEEFSSICSLSKSPVLPARTVNKNHMDNSLSNANVNIDFNNNNTNNYIYLLNSNPLKNKTPIKSISKPGQNSKLPSSNANFTSKLESSSKIPKTISNKFTQAFSNLNNKTINDYNNLNKNLLLNSTAKDKKSFNELILNKFTKSPNYAYKYNGLKYHNSNNFAKLKSSCIKNKNEIKNERRKSKSFNEKDFRALGIGHSNKFELEEIKSDDDIFVDLVIKDENADQADNNIIENDSSIKKDSNSKNKNNNYKKNSSKNRKNSDSPIKQTINADKSLEELNFLKKSSSNAEVEEEDLKSNVTSNNNSIILNNVNESEKGKNSDFSFISASNEKDPVTVRKNLGFKGSKQNKKRVNKSNTINKEDATSVPKRVIIFEKIQEEEKEMLIYNSRKTRRHSISRFALPDEFIEDELKRGRAKEGKDKFRKNKTKSLIKFELLDKIYKIVEKQSFAKFTENELDENDALMIKNREFSEEQGKNDNKENDKDVKNNNQNYLTFDSNNNNKNNSKNSIEDQERNEINVILNEDENSILNKIPLKRYSNVMKTFEQKLSRIQSPEFDIFELRSFVGPENILPVLSTYIFSVTDYFSFVNKKHFENFIYEISRGYIRDNLYHNDLHGADVAQSSFVYMTKGNFKETLVLTDVDCAGFLLASIIHDFKHPGVTNGFLINSRDLIALTYNDNSVLENFHVAEAFKIICLHKNCNIFSDLPKEDFKIIRKRIIELVLATDMTMHAKELAFIKSKLESLILLQNQSQSNSQLANCSADVTDKDPNTIKSSNGEPISPNNNNQNILKDKDKALIIKNLLENSNSTNLFTLQQEFLNIMIHMADISNPTKPTEIYMKWTDLVMNEFWMQGDKEKSLGLPISFLCDRVGASVPKAQIGFMDGIVMPLLICIVEIFPNLNFLKENIEKNKVAYKELLGKEEAEKQAQLQMKN